MQGREQLMNSNTYVVIPVYNEAKVVGGVVKSVKKHFEHVICIDDGSKDNSAEEILKAGGTLVKHPINLGQGASLQTGIEYALLDPAAEYFVTYDADGQHRLEDVQHMLDVIRKEQVDIVLGSRFLGKVENVSKTKKLLLRLAVVFSNHTSGVQLTDTHNGLRVFNRTVASQLNITMSDFAHASEIIERIAQKGFLYKEVPVTIAYTDYSRAKGQSMLNAVNIVFDLFLNKVIKK
jgi:glycosyltransferase involved in cell wall biosynthesis